MNINKFGSITINTKKNIMQTHKTTLKLCLFN